MSIAAKEHPPPNELQQPTHLEEGSKESGVTLDPGQSLQEFATEKQIIVIETENPPIQVQLFEEEDAPVDCSEEEVRDLSADQNIVLELVQPMESTEQAHDHAEEMTNAEQKFFFVEERLEGSSFERMLDTTHDLRSSDELQECHAKSTLEVTDEDNHDEQEVLHGLENEGLQESDVELIVAGIMAQEPEASLDTVGGPMEEEIANPDFQEFTVVRQSKFAKEIEIVDLTEETPIEAITEVAEPQIHKQSNPSENLNLGFETMEQSKDVSIDHEAMIAIAIFQKREKELEMCIAREYDEEESRREVIATDDRFVALEATRHEMSARVHAPEYCAEIEAERHRVNVEDHLRAEQTIADKDYKVDIEENRAASRDEAPADNTKMDRGNDTEPLSRRTLLPMDDRRPPDSETYAKLTSACRVTENAEVFHLSTIQGHFNDDAGMRLRTEAPDADCLHNMSEPGDHRKQRGSTHWHERKESYRSFGPSRFFQPDDRMLPPPRQDFCDGMPYASLRYEQHLDPPSRRREMSSAGRQRPSFQHQVQTSEFAQIGDLSRMKQRKPEFDERRQPIQFHRTWPPRKRIRQIDEHLFQDRKRSKEFTTNMYRPPGRDECENQKGLLSKQSVMHSNRTHGYNDAVGVHGGKRVRFSHHSDEEHAGTRITAQGAPRYEKNRNVKTFTFRSEKLTERPRSRDLINRTDEANNSRCHRANERLGYGLKSLNALIPPLPPIALILKGKKARGRDLTLTEIRDRGFKFLECDGEEQEQEQPPDESLLDSFDIFSADGDRFLE